MDQEKIGKLIKDLRVKSNMTQAEFAEKYGVTYQAVSKWENGKNLPDMLLLKQICNDFNINVDDILDGKIGIKKKQFKWSHLLPVLLLTLLISYGVLHNGKKDDNFEFRTISSNCSDFKISGSIAYNNNKSVIYISNVDYCGNNEDEIYKSIDCNLYEKNDNSSNMIGSCNFTDNENIKLEDYLKNVTINVNNYQRVCKEYSKDSLYLQINAINKDDKTITFNIPLSIEECK